MVKHIQNLYYNDNSITVQFYFRNNKCGGRIELNRNGSFSISPFISSWDDSLIQSFGILDPIIDIIDLVNDLSIELNFGVGYFIGTINIKNNGSFSVNKTTAPLKRKASLSVERMQTRGIKVIKIEHIPPPIIHTSTTISNNDDESDYNYSSDSDEDSDEDSDDDSITLKEESVDLKEQNSNMNNFDNRAANMTKLSVYNEFNKDFDKVRKEEYLMERGAESSFTENKQESEIIQLIREMISSREPIEQSLFYKQEMKSSEMLVSDRGNGAQIVCNKMKTQLLNVNTLCCISTLEKKKNGFCDICNSSRTISFSLTFEKTNMQLFKRGVLYAGECCATQLSILSAMKRSINFFRLHCKEDSMIKFGWKRFQSCSQELENYISGNERKKIIEKTYRDHKNSKFRIIR